MIDRQMRITYAPSATKALLMLAAVLLVPFMLMGQTSQRFTSLELALENPEKVQWLDLVCDDITSVSDYVMSLPNLESLYLTGCDLEELPKGIGQAGRLGLLNVQDNHLSHLPTELKDLQLLTVVNLRNNNFEEVPQVLSRLSNLREIDLSGNEQLDLDQAFTTLSKVEKLDFLYLAGLDMAKVPAKVKGLTRLEELHLSDNPGMDLAATFPH